MRGISPARRRFFFLICGVWLTLMAAFIVWDRFFNLGPSDRVRPEVSETGQSSPSSTDGNQRIWGSSESGIERQTMDSDANGADQTTPVGYKWPDPHPWLVKVKGEFHRRYVGPQNAEALMAVFNPHMQGEERAEIKALYQRVLDRGGVFYDDWDAMEYGRPLLAQLKYLRRYDQEWAEIKAGRSFETIRERFGLPESVSWEELENAEIDLLLKTWPVDKEQMNWAFKTGETILNVVLFPKSRAISISSVGPGDQRELTPEEQYNITRHGVAPKGFRLRFKDKEGNELPFDQVPFFSERKYIENLKDDELQELLFAIPGYLSTPDALERTNVEWMSMVDRYDAALELLAERGQVPAPAAVSGDAPGAAKPLKPMVDWGDPDPRRIQKGEPPGLREASDAEAVKAQEEARAAEAERRKRVAEAYVSALEKQAEKAKISATARSQISRRIQELRALMTGPTGPPVEPPPAQDSGGEDEEE